MFAFLQGFAYGLFLSCIPWFIVGMIKPRLALATARPRRWQVLVRYNVVLPFASLVLWLTSLWGGFGPSLGGWLLGLAAVAITLPVERRWRRWLERRRERQRERERVRAQQREREWVERREREAGLLVLDIDHATVDADEVVAGLVVIKRRLLDAGRPDLAVQADRLYTRYHRLTAILADKFRRGELTLERSRALVADVARHGIDGLTGLAALAEALASIDIGYVRRRLEARALPSDEREALRARQELSLETERRLQALIGRNEAVITALDEALVAVSRLNMDAPLAGSNGEHALQALRQFAQGADRYRRRP